MNTTTASTLRLPFMAALLAASLVGCGGGGGGSSTGNNVASITGTSTGSVAATANQATGSLTVSDADAGQATFTQPTSLTGSYGSWSVNISGATATWTYTVDASKRPSTTAQETLAIKSLDGSATQTITVTVSPGSGSSSALVITVPDPVYSGAYASEKVAVFNRLNSDRARCGFGKLAQNTLLDLAAQNHADYIALNKIANTHYETQGNPGFTGYDPSARFNKVGFDFTYGNEDLAQISWGTWYSGNPNYSAQELSATNILLLLYSTVYHLSGLTERTNSIGLGISNFLYTNDGTSNGKTLNIDTAVPAGNTTGQLIATNAIATFPCDGVSGLNPAFKGELPDPFSNTSGDNTYRNTTPYGQPVYVTSGQGTTLTLTSGTISKNGVAVPTTTLTSANDPNNRLLANQVFLVPTVRLADNSTYNVSLSGTSSGLVSASNPTGAWTKSFSFTTGTVLSE